MKIEQPLGREKIRLLPMLTALLFILGACGGAGDQPGGGTASLPNQVGGQTGETGSPTGQTDQPGGQTPAGASALDVAALGEKLYAGLEYRDQLEELPPEVVYTLLGIDAADVAAQKNYFSSGATAEEIIVFQAADGEAAARLQTALEARRQDQQDVYASYAPQEVAYLRQAILEASDNYVVFCVPVNPEAAAAIIKEALEAVRR
jgi:hypothetical protein